MRESTVSDKPRMLSPLDSVWVESRSPAGWPAREVPLKRSAVRSDRRHREDVELVERLLAGDRQAFDTFGERYFRALYRFALSRLRGDGELARDLVQTAITKALTRLDTYGGRASLMTWLCSCCNNEIRMHFRRRRSAPVEVALEDGAGPAAPDAPSPSGPFDEAPAVDPEAGLLDRETALAVHMTLDGLPDHYARVLEWKYLEQLPVKEIGSRLGVRPKAAESLLTRARRAFRTAYESLQTGPGPGAPPRFDPHRQEETP